MLPNPIYFKEKWLEVGVPTFYGQKTCWANREQVARLEQEPETVYAELLGFNETTEYLKWLASNGSVPCSGSTAAGKPCRNSLKGKTMLEPCDWRTETHSGGYCHVHGGG